MAYCSSGCQASDKPLHDNLCVSFKNLQPRPSENHYRAIHFPVNDANPRFVWMEFVRITKRDPTYNVPTGATLEEHVGVEETECYYLNEDLNLVRNYNHWIRLHHNGTFLEDDTPYNLSQHALLPHPDNRYWCGSFLAHGLKESDRALIHPGHPFDPFMKMIPLDLDTMSLAPIIAFMQYIPRCIREGGVPNTKVQAWTGKNMNKDLMDYYNGELELPPDTVADDSMRRKQLEIEWRDHLAELCPEKTRKPKKRTR
jgi:hypothetical protein